MLSWPYKPPHASRVVDSSRALAGDASVRRTAPGTPTRKRGREHDRVVVAHPQTRRGRRAGPSRGTACLGSACPTTQQQRPSDTRRTYGDQSGRLSLTPSVEVGIPPRHLPSVAGLGVHPHPCQPPRQNLLAHRRVLPPLRVEAQLAVEAAALKHPQAVTGPVVPAVGRRR